MKNLMVVSVMLLLLILPLLGQAEEEKEEIVTLEEVVVTATHKMKVLDTPASISIVTAEELERMGAKNVAEALKKIPGVIDTSSHIESLTIRGTQSSMAGGPIILIDGVPQKIGDYRYDQFNFIPISLIERVEVLRSAGIAYGPGSARGVINVITKKASRERPFDFKVAGSYGSWNTHNEYAGFSGGVDKWDYLLNGANYSTDGYEDEEQDRSSALLKLGYNLSEQTRIGLSSSLTKNQHLTAYGLWKKEWQLEHYRRDIHFPKSETDPTLVWHNEKKQDVSNTALEFSKKSERLFIDSAASWTGYEEEYKDMHTEFTDPDSVYFDDKGQDTYTFTLSGGYSFDFAMVSYIPSIGLRLEDINFDQRRSYPYDPGKDTASNDFDIDERQYGLFWDNDLFFGENWGIKIGARMDKAEVRFEDRVPTIVEQEETMYSWSIAPSYHFSGKANVYASVGRNFWFPTPRYYAWAAEKGGDLNRPEDLKPEESLTYEIGYKHLIHKAFSINLTGFFTKYDDKFDSIYEDDTWMGMKNVGEAEMKGVELEADGRPSPFFGYRLAGNYLNAEWTKAEVRAYEHPTNVMATYDLEGYDMYLIPEYTYVVGFDLYPLEGLKCSADITTYGPYYVDYLNRITYGSKTTADAHISYGMKNWKFWLLCKNILDEEIETPINTTGKLTEPNGEYDNAYYVQDGRYLEAGLSYHF